jgi:hypothetical protein
MRDYGLRFTDETPSVDPDATRQARANMAEAG